MDGRRFYDAVADHPGLEWLGVMGDDAYVGSGFNGIACRVPIAGILSEPWSALEPVLTGARRPRVLTHQARIVGYYSTVSNWNRSKLAELADRRAAPHDLGGAWVADAVPDEVIAALVAGGAEAACDARRAT